MQLYDLPRNTNIIVDGEQYMFHHLDGMYSYCTDKNENVIHFSAFMQAGQDFEIVNMSATGELI